MAAAKIGEAMLAVRGLHSFYGAVEALRGVDLEIYPGEIVALIGANGAGKSTLLMSLCGKPKPARGEIRFDGRNIAGLATSDIMRQGIAIVPEGRRIFPRMTVMENLQMGGVNSSPVHLERNLHWVHSIFPMLAARGGQRAGTLSGGEQQVLAIGRALMSRPKLLLLDEPSLGLAPILVGQIFSAIRQLNHTFRTTIFLVEQNAYHSLKIANRGYVMAQGRIALSGPSAELLANPGVRAAYLEGGGENLAINGAG